MDKTESYPLGLINWSGAKKGGVRQPFQKSSGRPVRRQLKTPLVKRLDDWVKNIVAGTGGTSRAIFLVGGPGNGKTDAVEGCIQSFDTEIGANGELYSAFARQYDVRPNLPPRRSEVRFPTITRSSDIEPVIRLVQDATEKDPASPDASAESLLLDELSEIFNGSYKGIYICCVNRGILANAASLASRNNDASMTTLLNQMVFAASGGPLAPSCWPLDNNKQIALWPMDVESLVSSYVNDEKKTIAHEILEAALDDKKWQPFCSNKTVCPYCQNKVLLSKPAAQNNLIKFLHSYELSSGKRWTFRDLFSLISYLLIGDSSELMISNRTYTPCDWTVKQLELASGNQRSYEATRASYLLVNKLYHHRLFSNWPRLASRNHFKAVRAVLAGNEAPSDELSEGYNLAKVHFKALKSLASNENNSINEILRTDFSASLDPGLLHGEHVFFSSKEHDDTKVTVDFLEERFSLSVKDGLELVRSRLVKSERNLLERLAKADEALFEHHYSPKVSNHVKLLQASVRQFAARFTKRSLGVRYGIPKDSNLFEDYAKLHTDNSLDKKVEKLVRFLVNENGKIFKIPLSTTFGQPVAHRDRNVSLLVNRVTTKLEKFPGDESRPAERTPYIKIHNRYIPITFNFFKALDEIKTGLNEASLPQEIFTLIDEAKSITAGQIAKDIHFINESADLEIGQERYTLDLENGIQFLDENDD